MGADRKGPLAAFIVVAIIAAVLLVTSVRSQAAPRWLDPDDLPTTVVAAPVTEPHLWGSVSEGVHQVVQEGVVLVRRAATDATDGTAGRDRRTEALGVSTSVATPDGAVAAGTSESHQVTVTPTHQATQRPHHPGATLWMAGADHDGAPLPPTSQTDPLTSDSSVRDRTSLSGQDAPGRHLGWSRGHGHVGNAVKGRAYGLDQRG